MQSKWLLPAIVVTSLTAGFNAWAEVPKLGLPAECTPGETCFVQNFVDLDPSPAKADPGCSTATNNGHKGTDLRIKTLRDMQKGVSVLAMAKGTVLRSRNNIEDRMLRTQKDRDNIQGRECGNGLVIDHGNGWTTQYCHMKKGSLSINPGDTVTKGQPLGQIGLSGETQFPHVHVSVRRGSQIIDPMTGRTPKEGCINQANLPQTTLWDEKTAAKFTLDGTAILEAGFSESPVNSEQIMSGEIPRLPDVNSKTYVIWTRMINLQKGDRIRFFIAGNKGLLVETTTKPLARPKATWIGFSGKRRSLKPGNYFGRIALIRNNKELQVREVTLFVQSR